ncbi:MAG TPA: nucleotidyltransferase family protein [Hyphomicrobiales bacterium]|nr:nucleotidyltransferase family protein [Hyphomicrobiales bacterium]
MVLAAGLGRRMGALTTERPKPMVEVGGRPLIDHVLDRLVAAGVDPVVVNVHHHADQLEDHLRRRARPDIVISDERDALLETGGGVRRALPLLGTDPFFVMNGDTIWIEDGVSNLARMAAAFDPARMDALLLLAGRAGSIGYEGRGDFLRAEDGRLARRPAESGAPFVFAGASILKPSVFLGTPEVPFSLNLVFDRAIAAGRLYGLPLAGLWMHVGTPEAVAEAERRYAAGVA